MVNTHIESLLLIDIETVSQYERHEQMPEPWKELWELKVNKILPEDETPESYYSKRAAILAEFGKVVCVSAGYFKVEGGRLVMRVKSFADHDERKLLQSVIASFNQWQATKKSVAFCGHNIKEFDIPYICRRLLVNGLPIPNYLDFQNMKPWETNMVDTLQLWKFGDFKNYISLNLLAACMEVPSPKDDIDGSMVGDVYWQMRDLDRIKNYCQKDVVTVGQLILKFKNLPLLTPEQVIVVE